LEQLRDRLRAFLEDKDISPEKLSKECGVHYATVYRFKNGADIKLSSWLKIQAYMDEHKT